MAPWEDNANASSSAHAGRSRLNAGGGGGGGGGALAIFQSKAAHRQERRRRNGDADAAARAAATAVPLQGTSATATAGRSLEEVLSAPPQRQARRHLPPIQARPGTAKVGTAPPNNSYAQQGPADAAVPTTRPHHLQQLAHSAAPQPALQQQYVVNQQQQPTATLGDAGKSGMSSKSMQRSETMGGGEADDADAQNKAAALLVGRYMHDAVEREYHVGELGLHDEATTNESLDAESAAMNMTRLPRPLASRLFGIQSAEPDRRTGRAQVLGALQSFRPGAVAEMQKNDDDDDGAPSDGEASARMDMDGSGFAMPTYLYHRLVSFGSAGSFMASLTRQQHYTSEDGMRIGQTVIAACVTITFLILALVLPDVSVNFWLHDNGGYDYEPGYLTVPRNVSRLELNLTACYLHVTTMDNATQHRIYVHRTLGTSDASFPNTTAKQVLQLADANRTARLSIKNQKGCAGSIVHSECYRSCFVTLYRGKASGPLSLHVNIGSAVDALPVASPTNAEGTNVTNTTDSSDPMSLPKLAEADSQLAGSAEVVLAHEALALDELKVSSPEESVQIKLLAASAIGRLSIHAQRGVLQSTPAARIGAADVMIGKGYVEIAHARDADLLYRTAKSRACLQGKHLEQPGVATSAINIAGSSSTRLEPCTFDGAAAFFDDKKDNLVTQKEVDEGLIKLGLIPVTAAELSRRDALINHLFHSDSNSTSPAALLETLPYNTFNDRLATSQSILGEDHHLFAPNCFQVALLSTNLTSQNGAPAPPQSSPALNNSSETNATTTPTPSSPPLDSAWLQSYTARSNTSHFFVTVQEGSVHFQVQAPGQTVADLDAFYKGFSGGLHPSVKANKTMAELQAAYTKDGKFKDALVFMRLAGPGVPNHAAWTWASRRVYMELGPAILSFLSASVLQPEISAMEVDLAQGFCEKSSGAVVYTNDFEWNVPFTAAASAAVAVNRNSTVTLLSSDNATSTSAGSNAQSASLREQRDVALLEMLMTELPNVVDGKPLQRTLWLRRAHNAANLTAVAETAPNMTRLYFGIQPGTKFVDQTKQWFTFPWYRRRRLSQGESLEFTVRKRRLSTNEALYVADESHIAAPKLIQAVWAKNTMIVITIALSSLIGGMTALVLIILLSAKVDRAIQKHRTERIKDYRALQINKNIIAEKTKAFGAECGMAFDPIARQLRNPWGNLFLQSSGWKEDAVVDDLSPEGTAAKWRGLRKEARSMLSFRRRAGAGLGASGGDALEKVAAKQAQFEKRGRNMKFASYKSTISYGVAQAYWGFFSLLGYTDSFNDVMLAHARLVTFRMGSELSKIASETAGALGANTNPQDGMSPMHIPHQNLLVSMKAKFETFIAALAEVERQEDTHLKDVVDKIQVLIRKRRPVMLAPCMRMLERAISSVESKGASLASSVLPTRVRSSLPSVFQRISEVIVRRLQGFLVNSLREFVNLKCYRNIAFGKLAGGIGGTSGIVLPGDFPNTTCVELMVTPQSLAAQRLCELDYVSVNVPSPNYMKTVAEHIKNFRIFAALFLLLRSAYSKISGGLPLICTHVVPSCGEINSKVYWTTVRETSAESIASRVCGVGDPAYQLVLGAMRAFDGPRYRVGAPILKSQANVRDEPLKAASFLLRAAPRSADNSRNITYMLGCEDEGVLRSITLYYAHTAELAFRTTLRKFRANYLRFCRKSGVDAVQLDDKVWRKLRIKVRDRFPYVLRGVRHLNGKHRLDPKQRYNVVHGKRPEPRTQLDAFLREADVEVTNNKADHAVLMEPLLEDYKSYLRHRGLTTLAKQITENSFCAELEKLLGIPAKREKYTDLYGVLEMPSGGPDVLQLNVLTWFFLQLSEVLTHVTFVLLVPVPAMLAFLTLQNTVANIESLTGQQTGTFYLLDLKTLVHSPFDGFAFEKSVQPTFLYGMLSVLAWIVVASFELGNYYIMGERLNFITRSVRLLFYAVLGLMFVLTCAYIVSAFCWVVLGVIINPNIFLPYIAAAGTLVTSVTSSAKALAKKAQSYADNIQEKNARKFEMKINDANAEAMDPEEEVADDSPRRSAELPGKEPSSAAAAPAPMTEQEPGSTAGPVVESFSNARGVSSMGTAFAGTGSGGGVGFGPGASAGADGGDAALFKTFKRYAGADEEIEYSEFRAIFNDLNVSLPEDRIQKLYASADTDGSGSIGYQEFKTAWGDIQAVLVEEAMNELGLSPGRRSFLVCLGALILICMFVFIFVGVKAFLGSDGTVGAVVNSGLCVGGGGAMQGAKPKEEVDEAEVDAKIDEQDV